MITCVCIVCFGAHKRQHQDNNKSFDDGFLFYFFVLKKNIIVSDNNVDSFFWLKLICVSHQKGFESLSQ